MKNYEGIIIIKPGLTEDTSQKLLEQLQAEVSKNGGKVENTEKWGKRTLAYPIKKNKEGHYYKLDFVMEPGKVAELRKAYRLNEDVLRAMITKK